MLSTIFGMKALFSQAQSDNKSSKIVNSEWLSDHLSDPNIVILHVAAVQADYKREHISGARFIWPGWFSYSTPESSVQPLPDAEMIKTLRKLGISNNSKIVLTFSSGLLIPACRIYLSLDYFGLGDQTYLLNGGIDSWKAAGKKVTIESVKFKKGNFIPKIRKNVFVDTTFILKNLQDSVTVIVDSRSAPFYEGKTGTPRLGHIPGAKNIPSTTLYNDKTFSFLTDDKLLEILLKQGITKEKKIVNYCFVGNASCIVYFIARYLGYQTVLYDGSMEEWGNDFNLPMEKHEENK